MLELPGCSAGSWEGKRAVRWEAGWSGARWDPSRAEGTGMGGHQCPFCCLQSWGCSPGCPAWRSRCPSSRSRHGPGAGELKDRAGTGAGAGPSAAPRGGQTTSVGCRVPDPAPDCCVTSALHVSHEDVSCDPSSGKPSGSAFWETEPCLAKLMNPSPISLQPFRRLVYLVQHSSFIQCIFLGHLLCARPVPGAGDTEMTWVQSRP